MNHSGLVSIILLNCNGKKWNRNCIDSILLQTYDNFEIIFVNNMSTDGSLEEVQHIYKKEIEKGLIKIVLNSSNTGFTGGNNLGVQYSSNESEYICLLNNDTTLGEDWLKNLVKSIQTDKKLGAVQSIILEGDVENLKKQIFVDKKWFIYNIFSGIGSYKKITDNEFKNNLCYTTWVHGCCILYKKNIIKTPFEDYYFIYHEDSYFSYRLLSLGYKLGMSLNSTVNHHGSGTCGKVTEMKQYRITRNRIINYLVFMPYFIGIIYLPLLIIYETSTLLFGNVLLNCKLEIKSIIRIVKNRGFIKKTHSSIKNNRHISFFKFMNLLCYLPFPKETNVNILSFPKIILKSIIYFVFSVYYYLTYPIIYLFCR